MSDSDAERQRKLKAGRAKLMEFKQMKKKKKKAEAVAATGSQSGNNSQSGSQPVAREAPRSSSRMSASKEASRGDQDDNGDQDTENDAASLSSVGNSNPASPIPHESGDNSYTSGSEYTSADESYTYSEDGVDSLVVANLERNELKNRVIELEENLRGKQAVMKDLNKENYELRAKLQNYQSGSRQESSPSPILRKELESLQETLKENQTRLEEINKENHEMRAKLAHGGHEDKSHSSNIEEMKLSLESKQQMLEALNFQNEELIKENKNLKSRARERSPDNSQSDSQVESLQESLRAKQTVLSELNKQNQELRERIHELSQAGVSDGQMQSYKRKIADLQSENGLKDDEIERLKAIEISFMQTKEVMKELSMQSSHAKEELEKAERRYKDLQTDTDSKEKEMMTRYAAAEQQLEQVQSEYHSIVTVNNDHLMKIQILENQIATLDKKLNEKETKMAEFDTQVSLAVGERDAVQLEARAQIEDFEEKIKIMQEQLQKNGATLHDYEDEISKATAELASTKKLVVASERILDAKNQEIKVLEKKLETIAKNGDQLTNERNIYVHEIEGLKKKVEEKQTEMKDLTTVMNENQAKSQALISQKEAEISKLEKEKSELEKLKAEEVDNMQAHFDRVFEEHLIESQNKFREEAKRLEAKKMEEVKDIENGFEVKLAEIRTVFEKNKEVEIKETICKFEVEHKVKAEEMQKQLTEAIVQQGAEETKAILRENEERIVAFEELIAKKGLELEDCKQQIGKLENALAGERDELSNLKENGRLESEGLSQRCMDAERKVTEMEKIISEKTITAEEAMKLVENLEKQNTEIVAKLQSDLSNQRQEYEDKIKLAEIELMNLKNAGERDKAEFMQFMKEVEILRVKLSESSESENRLQETVSTLKKEKKDNDELLLEFKDQKEEKEKANEELREENKHLKEILDKKDEERTRVNLDYESEIKMLKSRMEVMKSENNNEMLERFNQSMDKLKEEKDEQIRNLKEEIAHVKEGNDKYVQKMQSDFECDMKHVEDENHSLKVQLRDLKEVSDKEKTSRDSGVLREIEAMQEKHRVELAEVKASFEKGFQEDQLRTKEEQWQQLKRFEAERETEMKRVVEECENNKREALEILRQQLEEERHKEVHDVVCNMTKEQKEAVLQMKAEMEKQLKLVQEERDAELRNIQQEYQSFKESKKQETEELLANQIAKYQEEQLTLQKRLHKAEGRLRKFNNEKEELAKQLESKHEEETEILRRKLRDAEDRLNALVCEQDELVTQLKRKDALIEKGNQIPAEVEGKLQSERPESSARVAIPLRNLLEDLRSEIHNLSRDGGDNFNPMKSEESYDNRPDEELESSLDKELSEITRLCKGQIVDLAYKLKNMKTKYDNSEKNRNEVSYLNQTLQEDLHKLEAELKSNQEQLNNSYQINESLKENSNILQAEVEGLSNEKEELKKSFDVIDGGSFAEEDIRLMSGRLAEIAAEVESKLKQKEELDRSLSEMKSEISVVKSGQGRRGPIVEEDVSVMSIQHEEVAIVPEFLEELETVPLEEFDGAKDEKKAEAEEAQPMVKEETAFDRDLELKHLQKLLVESNDKQEQQKQEVKELQEALENERNLFAEQLRARVSKEAEARTAQENISSEVLLREKRDFVNRISMLEQKLKDKERLESDLKDENWRLVNLLKDSNIDLCSEKESLQDQLEKQEDIIQELQTKMSTSDLVTNEIQEAFGRQLAALHRQRDALLEQLEHQKRNHQGFAKVIQEKAALEDRLREEKEVLSEKLRQKEALEMELAAERAALNEKLIELEKLREMLNGKERLTEELTEQRDELKMELTAIEDRLRGKEEDLSIEREELERELALKDYELKKWEENFKAKENELLEHEESLRENFSQILESTRSDLESRNDENLRQLRTDLDTDYRGRLALTEEGLHSQYGQQISRLQEEHDDQVPYYYYTYE